MFEIENKFTFIILFFYFFSKHCNDFIEYPTNKSIYLLSIISGVKKSISIDIGKKHAFSVDLLLGKNIPSTSILTEAIICENFNYFITLSEDIVIEFSE